MKTRTRSDGKVVINMHPDPTEGLWTARAATETEAATQNENDAAQRADYVQRTRDKLLDVMAQTGLALSSNEWAAWRPTKETGGHIDGLEQRVTCLATDGNLGWFAASTVVDGATHFKGHVHRFRWQNAEGEDRVGAPPAFYAKDSAPKARGVATKRKRKTRAERLNDLLNSI